MKRRALMIALSAFFLASQQASAHTVHLFARMSGDQENPPNDSLGRGTSHVFIDLDLLQMRVIAEFSGLTGTTTQAHIHCCAAPPANVGVATVVPSFVGFPNGVLAGTYDHTYDMSLASSYNPAFITANGGTVDAAFQEFYKSMIDDNEGRRAYFNIHTTFRAPGEIRGFFSVVPEPSSVALIVFGCLAGAPWWGRRLLRKSAN